jgi:WD40 repeat protein
VSLLADPTKAWEIKSFKHPQILTTCKFTRCGEAVLAGSFDGKIHRWVLESGRHDIVGEHPAWISAILAGSDRIYSADFQGNLRAWDLATDQRAWWVDAAHPGWLKTLALSPDGSLLASGARDGVVRLWSAADGKLARELKGHGRDVYSAAFHPDGRSLATGDYDGKILHWDLTSGKLVRTLDAGILVTRSPEFLCDVGGVRALAFDAKGGRLAASGLRDVKSNTFCPGTPAGLVFDWESGKATTTLKPKDDKIDGGIIALRFLSDGTLVGCAEGQSSGAIWFWKPGEADPFHAVGGQSVYEVDIRPDGLAVAGAFFINIGKGGNGRGDKRGEYVSNGGLVRLFGLYEKPAGVKPAPKPAKKK